MDSVAVIQDIETNLVSSPWRVSGELSIAQFSEVHRLHDLGKNIQSCRTVSLCLALPKYCKTFDSPYSYLIKSVNYKMHVTNLTQFNQRKDLL